MSSPSQSPLNRQPAPFDRRILHRSVIAVPLAEAIAGELEATARLKKQHAKVLQETEDTAIFLRSDVGITRAEAATARITELLDEAIRDVGARERQAITATHKLGDQFVCLGHLDGLVIQQMLAIDAQNAGGPIIERIWPTRHDVIIDINLAFEPLTGSPPPEAAGGRLADRLDVRVHAKELIARYIEEAKRLARTADPDQGVDVRKTRLSTQYVFARLEGVVILELVAIDDREARRMAGIEATAAAERTRASLGDDEAERRLGRKDEEAAKLVSRFRTIHHIWPDFRLQSCITRSIATVKVDAAHRSFTALGEGITWAVLDSGVAADHPHFREHQNIDPASPYHEDFTGLQKPGSALRDEYGHGTHVAGIIAGSRSQERGGTAEELTAAWPELGPGGSQKADVRSKALDSISGMAPKCRIVSLKVLDRFGGGMASNVITAIAHIQAINHNGRELHIHGVNLSLGYPFDPKWFACGHSPLCVEVNRLVKSGVVVVVAAGNTGYGTLVTKEGQSDTSLDLTINDPGNAEHAITVGSTHRDEPHRYGVSYFSSKGPTGDGRYKPDLLAPGERIVSCAAKGSRLVTEEAGGVPCSYFETSGTSMAAPHVSGAIAAFLSIRREFVGEPLKVKQIFTSTATDLGRNRYFQGSGLVDLMRAIQSV